MRNKALLLTAHWPMARAYEMQDIGAEHSICLCALVLAAAYDPCNLKLESDTEERRQTKMQATQGAFTVTQPRFF